jgi:outer membrane lipopolysaccharide assembly protein LptE/RlpB
MRRWDLITLLIIGHIAAAVSGCGYRLSAQGTLPGNIQSLNVQMIVNRSAETGAEISLTNALISELNRRRTGLVVDAGAAEATLSGAIESITWDTVSRKGLSTAAERRVYATASLVLVAAADGGTLWKRSRLRAEQAYTVVDGNKQATENNRRNAVREVFDRLAEKVYRDMTDQF